MKKRFSEEQIIGFLGEAEAGLPIKELCRRHGFSEASYYLWRSKFGCMSAPGQPCDPPRRWSRGGSSCAVGGEVRECS